MGTDEKVIILTPLRRDYKREERTKGKGVLEGIDKDKKKKRRVKVQRERERERYFEGEEKLKGR